jgi:predicted nucleotidyltransferase
MKMIRTDTWQAQTIEELQNLLMPSEQVLALALFGSALKPDDQFDIWSDLDCLLVVTDDAFSQYYPATGWLSALGTLYARQQSENVFHGTTRACFTDFRWLDFVITTQSKLERLPEWSQVPFYQGVRLLFSRSTHVAHLLSRTWPTPEPTYPSSAGFDEMVNDFWFKAMLASYKVIRDDRLIALHLALDLVRDCCVIGMMLRDRTEGTNVHRHGGTGNYLVARLESIGLNYSVTGILNIIEQSATQFDQLAAQWSDVYDERRFPLVEWLEHIKRRDDIG